MSYPPPSGGPPGGPPPGGPYQPPPGYGGVPREHSRSTVVLVLGILGFLCWPFVAIVAVVMGAIARNEIAASPGMYSGEGKVNAGFILGIVWLVLGALGTLLALTA